MNSVRSKIKKPIAEAFLAASCIAVIMGLAAAKLEAADNQCFKMLLESLSSSSAENISRELSSSTIAQTAAFFGCFFFTAASVWAGFKLGSPARFIVLLQLLVMSLLYQWALWQCTGLPGMPLSFSLSILLGCCAGAALKQREMERREGESRYYELKIRNRELQETRLSLVKQDEVERRMLAADLHDQVLNDMKQLLGKFENYVENPEDDDSLEKVRSLSARVMHEIREVMENLCPSVLENLGLPAAIEDCLRRGAERSGFKIRFKSKIKAEDLCSLSLVEQSLLYRLVQESITNICKHAGARTVRINIDNSEGCLLISIIDDGKGLDPEKPVRDSRGLKYMRLRADLIGATISWKSGENDKGTRVDIRLDLTNRQAVHNDD